MSLTRKDWQPWSLAMVIIAAYLALVVSGVIKFAVWSQVQCAVKECVANVPTNMSAADAATAVAEAQAEAGVSSVNEASSSEQTSSLVTYAHSIRLWLVHPIGVFAKVFGLDPDRVFSAVVALNMMLTAFCLAQSVKPYQPKYTPIIFSGLLLVLCTLSLWMNGRMSFSFLGLSLWLWFSQHSRANPSSSSMASIVSLISALLCSVSSGGFLVFFLINIVWFALNASELAKKHIILLMMLILVLAVEALQAFVFVDKVLVFYHVNSVQDITRVLGHGLGVWGLPILVLVSVIGFVALKKLYALPYFWFLCAIAMSCVVGITGYGALSLVVLPVLALVTTTIIHLVDKRKNELHYG